MKLPSESLHNKQIAANTTVLFYLDFWWIFIYEPVKQIDACKNHKNGFLNAAVFLRRLL